jgi:mRNA-degrading endonuclease RelE of RelBE toxin-antitoxin system
MAWTVIIAKPAQKQAAKFPAKDRARIGSAVASMGDDPFAGDVLKLEGEDNLWRRASKTH